MKESDMLRALANDLRNEDARRAEIRRGKAASVLVAAAGFGMLSAKLGGSRG